MTKRKIKQLLKEFNGLHIHYSDFADIAKMAERAKIKNFGDLLEYCRANNIKTCNELYINLGCKYLKLEGITL